jgi:hypothetical protein
MPLVHGGQVRSDRRGIEPLGVAARAGAVESACRRCLADEEHGEDLALVDGVADGDLDAPHDAIGFGDHLVLHLHRLEHDHCGSGAHRLAG